MLKSVTRGRILDKKAKLDSVRHIYFNLKNLVTLFFFLFTECHGAKFKHMKLSVHHHLCRESVLQSNSSRHLRLLGTLESGISVPTGINVPMGKIGKNNKRTHWNKHTLWKI